MAQSIRSSGSPGAVLHGAGLVGVMGVGVAFVSAPLFGFVCISRSADRSLGGVLYDVRPAVCSLEGSLPIPLWALGLVALFLAAVALVVQRLAFPVDAQVEPPR